MTARDWLTLRFASPVRLETASSVEEFMANLRTLTAPRFSTAKFERKKPLRGILGAESGVLRFPLNEYRFQSPRSLHFKLIETGSGCLLEGEFVVWLAFRVIVMGWLCAGVAFWLGQNLYVSLRSGAGWPLVCQGVLSVVIGLAMAYGYTGLCLLVSRGRERDLLRVLGTIAKGDAATEVARELLIR